MKLIASYIKPEDAHLAASLLEGNGLTVSVRDSDTVGNYWMYSNAVGGVKLEVAEDEVEEAKAILNLPKDANGLLACPHCGSGNVKIREMNLFTAMSLALGCFLPFSTKKVDCFECKKSFELDLQKLKADATDGAQV